MFISTQNNVSVMYSGYILFCNNIAQEQCLRKKQYTCADKETAPTEEIKAGTILFLYNTDDKTLLGPFTALTEGGKQVDTGAWAMDIDQHSASQNVMLEWEKLHLLDNAPAKLPFLDSSKSCELSTTQVQRTLDILKSAPLYIQEKMTNQE